MKWISLLCFLLILLFSCKRLDGDTLVEGQAVDRNTGQGVPNATVAVMSMKTGSWTGGYSVMEEHQADANGNFGFQFDGDGGNNYVLMASAPLGYSTRFGEAVEVKRGRNNKGLKVKMEAPAWVRVKIVNDAPKFKISSITIWGFLDDENGNQTKEYYYLRRDTSFVRKVIAQMDNQYINWEINDSLGFKNDYHSQLFCPSLDTTEFTIHY